ncbi:MAG: hypothetical protein AAF401_07390 [Pseudomonadota bacterium]
MPTIALAALIIVALVATIFVARALGFLRKRRWIVVDGSNVMYWRDGTPDPETVVEVMSALKKAGFDPCIVFDANAGYLLFGRHANEAGMSGRLGIVKDHILVAKSGQPADPLILSTARDFDCLIVTNDQFRDWVEAYPEVLENGRLVKGRFVKGSLQFDF